jgi:glyoxylate reductase
VVTLHTPLTPATQLVDARQLGLMKPTSIFVNTARGALRGRAALIADRRPDRRAGLDVLRGRPPALTCPRLVLAPHIGSATTETRTRMAQLCADAVIAVLSGRRPSNLVNSEVLAGGSP